MVQFMKKEREQKIAKELRAKGYSIKQIAEKLHVSKGSVSPWVRGVTLDKLARANIEETRIKAREKANTTNRNKKKARLLQSEIRAREIVSQKDHHKILLAMIYWCEGVKNDSSMTFINSDPHLIASFLSLMRHEFEIDESKFRVCVHLHAYHDRDKQLNFWSKTTTIPRRQFMKPYQKDNTGIQKKEGYQGCASIRYYDATMAQLLLAIAREQMKGL